MPPPPCLTHSCAPRPPRNQCSLETTAHRPLPLKLYPSSAVSTQWLVDSQTPKFTHPRKLDQPIGTRRLQTTKVVAAVVGWLCTCLLPAEYVSLLSSCSPSPPVHSGSKPLLTRPRPCPTCPPEQPRTAAGSSSLVSLHSAKPRLASSATCRVCLRVSSLRRLSSARSAYPPALLSVRSSPATPHACIHGW